MTDGMPQRGFVYIVAGAEKYLDELATSIESLRRVISDAHITIITTSQMHQHQTARLDTLANHVALVDQESLDSAKSGNKREQWRVGLLFKTKFLYEYCPYEQAIFLDTDTYIVKDCSHLFDLLTHYDMAVASTPGDYTPITGDEAIVTRAHHNVYNTGVLIFKKNETTEIIFQHWTDIYTAKHRQYPNDQAAFTEAISLSDCKIFMLRPIWNLRVHFPAKIAEHVEILHGRPNNWDHIVREINISDHARYWFYKISCCYWSNMPLHLLLRFINKLLFFHIKQGIRKKFK